MPCAIVQGREIDCRDSVGGVVEFTATEFNNVPQANITYSSGVITAATCSAGKRFFTYQLEKENAQFDTKIIVSTENGTTYCESTFTLNLKKMSAALKNNLLTLAYNRLHLNIKDGNGTIWWMGLNNGADLTGSDGTTGKALGDMNGETLTFVSKEPLPPQTLSAAIYASLKVGS